MYSDSNFEAAKQKLKNNLIMTATICTIMLVLLVLLICQRKKRFQKEALEKKLTDDADEKENDPLAAVQGKKREQEHDKKTESGHGDDSDGSGDSDKSSPKSDDRRKKSNEQISGLLNNSMDSKTQREYKSRFLSR